MREDAAVDAVGGWTGPTATPNLSGANGRARSAQLHCRSPPTAQPHHLTSEWCRGPSDCPHTSARLRTAQPYTRAERLATNPALSPPPPPLPSLDGPTCPLSLECHSPIKRLLTLPWCPLCPSASTPPLLPLLPPRCHPRLLRPLPRLLALHNHHHHLHLRLQLLPPPLCCPPLRAIVASLVSRLCPSL